MIHYSVNKLKNREENLKRNFTWMKKDILRTSLGSYYL